MAGVVGHEHKIFGDGMGGDLRIENADRLADALQMCPRPREMLSSRPCPIEARHGGQEYFHYRLEAVRIGGERKTEKQLGFRDY